MVGFFRDSKASFGGGFGGRRDFGGRGGSGNRGGFRREMHKAVCAECKKECEVPFKPKGDRPVYCLDCYKKRKGESSFGAPREAKPKAEEAEKAETESEDLVEEELESEEAEDEEVKEE